MIKFTIRGKRNPKKPEDIKYYPQIAPGTSINMEQIIKKIEKRCTLSSPDVRAVVDALQYEVIEALESGNSVRLGSLGSFRLTLQAKGAESVSDAKKRGVQLIKRVNVQYTKSTTMRDALQLHLLDFALQSDIVNASESVPTPEPKSENGSELSTASGGTPEHSSPSGSKPTPSTHSGSSDHEL